MLSRRGRLTALLIRPRLSTSASRDRPRVTQSSRGRKPAATPRPQTPHDIDAAPGGTTMRAVRVGTFAVSVVLVIAATAMSLVTGVLD
jgi:hypothetical protein